MAIKISTFLQHSNEQRRSIYPLCTRVTHYIFLWFYRLCCRCVFLFTWSFVVVCFIQMIEKLLQQMLQNVTYELWPNDMIPPQTFRIISIKGVLIRVRNRDPHTNFNRFAGVFLFMFLCLATSTFWH